jgi:hypothetical protein
MRLKGTEYGQRLMTFSKSTLLLMQEVHCQGREQARAMHNITTDSTLSEAEVRLQLTRLLEQKSTKKQTP